MKFDKDIKLYGNVDFRGDCPSEAAEQITFFNAIRKTPYGAIALHIRNEGKRNKWQASRHQAEGMLSGASDIIIPASPAFVCEMKRRDHTKSRWQKGQLEFLKAAKKHGAFVCVALGFDAAWEAFNDWKIP